jgi:hypothetical protein
VHKQHSLVVTVPDFSFSSFLKDIFLKEADLNEGKSLLAASQYTGQNIFMKKGQEWPKVAKQQIQVGNDDIFYLY